jgi:hypothetical protein
VKQSKVNEITTYQCQITFTKESDSNHFTMYSKVVQQSPATWCDLP